MGSDLVFRTLPLKCSSIRPEGLWGLRWLSLFRPQHQDMHAKSRRFAYLSTGLRHSVERQKLSTTSQSKASSFREIDGLLHQLEITYSCRTCVRLSKSRPDARNNFTATSWAAARVCLLIWHLFGADMRDWYNHPQWQTFGGWGRTLASTNMDC